MLQGVKSGERYLIGHKVEPIAELVPPQTGDRQARSKRAPEKLLQLVSTRAPVGIDIEALIDAVRGEADPFNRILCLR